MTISEAHIAFKIGLDKIDSLNYPDILPEEIDFLLNQAQDRFVKQRYGKTNTKREAFEETQKRTEDLKTIVKTAHISPSALSIDNISNTARFYILPVEHRYIIQEQVDISYTDCHGTTTTKKVLVRPIQHDDYDKILYDPFNIPNDVKVLRLMAEGQVELIAGTGYTLGSYFLRYLKAPNRVSITTNISFELPEDVHQEIVDIAVDLALENIESKRTQTFNKIINTQE
jgi:hypothetical protein